MNYFRKLGEPLFKTGAFRRFLGLGFSGFSTGGKIVYLLRDEFTTSQAAPLTSPRTCEPGPGTLTITDTENKFSISGGNLVKSSTTVTIARITAAQTAAVGLCVKFKTNVTAGGGNYYIGFGQTDTDAVRAVMSIVHPNNFGVFDGYYTDQREFAVIINATSYKATIINLTTKKITYIKSGTGLLAWLILNTSNDLFSLDYLKMAQLPAPWNDEWGLATARTASPPTGATLAHEASCLAEITWTASTGVTAEFDLRYTDANNRLCVRCSQGGSTIKVIEIISGVETERSSAAQTWTNGTSYRVVLVLDGTTIRTYVANTLRNTYASVSASLTGTNARVTASAGAMSNFVTYPRILSGDALAALEAI